MGVLMTTERKKPKILHHKKSGKIPKEKIREAVRKVTCQQTNSEYHIIPREDGVVYERIKCPCCGEPFLARFVVEQSKVVKRRPKF